MRVLMISKALVVAAYRRKLDEIARHLDVELICVAPRVWAGQEYEPDVLPNDVVANDGRRGYRMLVAPIRFDGNFHLFYFPTLGRILKHLRPDVVHVDEEPYNLATALAVTQARHVGARPLFFTWQNLNRRYLPPFRWFEHFVYARSAYAIAGNAEAVDVLRQKGYRGPASVIPQFGVDPTIFRPASSLPDRSTPASSQSDAGLANVTRRDPPTIGPGSQVSVDDRHGRPFTIGYVGRLVEEKGLMVLLDAVTHLGRPDVRLRIVGSGPLEPELRSQAAQRGLAARVSIEPFVPSIQVPDLLRGLDALVLPSLTRPNWKEQFGRVTIEAMACGVPVVGSSSGEIPQVIGDAGLVVPEGEAAPLAVALASLVDDAVRCQDLATRGRQRVLAEFTQAAVAARTVQVYRRVMAAG
ncbi:MAG: glycosyltransferase [Chloroflexi bacterium]|nr:glycosyltransferase [Chloroflexota bacterium]